MAPCVEFLPYRYQDIFKQRGSFRFTAKAVGDGVRSEELKVRVTWHGSLDSLTAKPSW